MRAHVCGIRGRGGCRVCVCVRAYFDDPCKLRMRQLPSPGQISVDSSLYMLLQLL